MRRWGGGNSSRGTALAGEWPLVPSTMLLVNNINKQYKRTNSRGTTQAGEWRLVLSTMFYCDMYHEPYHHVPCTISPCHHVHQHILQHNTAQAGKWPLVPSTMLSVPYALYQNRLMQLILSFMLPVPYTHVPCAVRHVPCTTGWQVCWGRGQNVVICGGFCCSLKICFR